MDDLIQILVDAVEQAGGAMTWEALIDSVDYKQRQQVPKALKIAKAKKLLKRDLRFVEGKKLHRVLAWSHPDNPKRDPDNAESEEEPDAV